MPSATDRPKLRIIDGGACGAQDAAAVYTIADVADACRLPQPVIAQLVPRIWTSDGWMYTPAQLSSAVEIAEEMRSNRGFDPS
jgi:hypothetical protein